MNNKTTEELHKIVGQSFYVELKTQTKVIYVACVVLDTKKEYGHVRYLVRTVAGNSEWWTQKLGAPYIYPKCKHE